MDIADIEFLFAFIILPHLIPFTTVFIYETKIAQYKKLWLSLLPLTVIIPVSIYGYLRKIGKIIYKTDAPADILWSDWCFNGTLIFTIGYSALLGLLSYLAFRFIKNILQRTK